MRLCLCNPLAAQLLANVDFLQCLEAFELAQIGNAVRQIRNLSYQGQTVAPESLVLGHDQHLVEELVDSGNEGDNDIENLIDGRSFDCAQGRLLTVDGRLDSPIKRFF